MHHYFLFAHELLIKPLKTTSVKLPIKDKKIKTIKNNTAINKVCSVDCSVSSNTCFEPGKQNYQNIWQKNSEITQFAVSLHLKLILNMSTTISFLSD